MRNNSKKGWKSDHVYGYIIKKLTIALVALLLTQTAFLLLNLRHFYISDLGEALGIVWGNIRFGLATLCLVLAPWILINILPLRLRWSKTYRIVSDLLYWIPTVVVLVVNLVDVAYFQFTYRRMSSEMFAYMGVGGNMGTLIPKFLVDFWPTTVSGLCILFLFMVCSHRTIYPLLNPYDRKHTNDWVGFTVCALLTFFFIRGGFGRYPIELNDAARYCKMENTPTVFNSPYNIICTYGQPDLDSVQTTFMSDEEARVLFDPVFTPLVNNENHNIPIDYGYLRAGDGQTSVMGSDSVLHARFRNVVVIILESFAQEYLNFYNEELDVCYTPFLDSLSQHSLLFRGFSNGKKSIESIPAIMSSLPTLTDKPLTMSDYKDNKMAGLPQILKKYNYSTSFFHGSYNGVMAFDQFCKKIGFDMYYGQNEYPDQNESDGSWGIFDEPYLQFAVRQLSRSQEPFFSGIFTISSHHPYAIPKQYKGVFTKGEHPIIETIGYVDNALRKFFDAASKEPWYNNTLFIITGDHPGVALSRTFNSPEGMYRVPMMVFDPQHTEGSRFDRIMQQADIMPTVIDYLGLDEPCIAFGSSIFQREEGFQIVYGSGYYQLINNQGVSMLEMTHRKNYELNAGNGVQLLKAILQQYTQRMINNSLNISTDKNSSAK